MKKLFDISLPQIILSLIISGLIGGYLYFGNSKKISIQYWYDSAVAIPLNSCASINYQKNTILSKEDIQWTANSIQVNDYDKPKISIDMNENRVLFKVNGLVENSKNYDQFMANILEKLNVMASTRFANVYEPSKVHCNGVEFSAFQLKPFADSTYRLQVFRYSSLHLFMLACLPFIVFFLIFLILNYKKYYLNKKA